MNKTKLGRPVGTVKHLVPTRINGKISPQYSRYQAMIQRCSNPNHKGYRHYGGRGITVCERWLGKQGFDNFVMDMGSPIIDGMTLDRIDNSLGYFRENCRWASWKEQGQNRRKTEAVLVRDPDSLRQKALKVGLPYSTLYQRVKLHGWSLEQAIATPHLGHGKPVGGWKRQPVQALSSD